VEKHHGAENIVFSVGNRGRGGQHILAGEGQHERRSTLPKISGRRDVTRREATRRAETEHRIERRMTVRCQETAIRAAMAAIEAAGNGDGGALQ
jgi:hypothetical protein